VEMPPVWQLYRLRSGRALRVEIYRDEDRALEAAGLADTTPKARDNPEPRA
jgi:hypothetical protein